MSGEGILVASIIYVIVFLNLVVGIWLFVVLLFIPVVIAEVFHKRKKNLYRGVTTNNIMHISTQEWPGFGMGDETVDTQDT